MSKIDIVKIDKNNLILQFLCGGIIIAACFISKYIVFLAGIMAMAYLFSEAKWEQKFSLFMFLLSFSTLFKFSAGQTSLFMFLRIAVILSYAFQSRKKFGFTFITLIIALFTYCMIVSEVYNSNYLISAINLILWLLIGYVIVNTLTDDRTTPVLRSLSNGVIITGIIGLFLDKIPQLYNEIRMIRTLAEDGAYVLRYAGFWEDPNFFTVLIVASLWFGYYEFNNRKVSIVEFLSRSAITSFLGLMTMSKSCVLLLVVFWIYILIAKNNIKTSPKVGIFFTLIIAVLIFLWRNPYWITDLLYRFTGGNERVTSDVLTTGRTDIWRTYIAKLLDDFTWIFGNGLNAKNLDGKAMHNVIIQAIYYIGIAGTVLHVTLFVSIFNSTGHIYAKNKTKSPAKYALISFLAILMFLDGFLIELFYYMIPMSFVYILSANSADKSALSAAENVE